MWQHFQARMFVCFPNVTFGSYIRLIKKTYNVDLIEYMDTTGRLLSNFFLLFFPDNFFFPRKTLTMSQLSPLEFQKRSEQFFKLIFRFAKKPNTVNKIQIIQKGLKYFFQNQIFWALLSGYFLKHYILSICQQFPNFVQSIILSVCYEKHLGASWYLKGYSTLRRPVKA